MECRDDRAHRGALDGAVTQVRHLPTGALRMSEVWYTSDLHLGHQLVSDLRGFANVDEHDAAVLDGWMAHVRANDVVWVLGDLTLKNPHVWLPIIKKLPGIKHLIPGNHDPVHPMHRDAHKWQRAHLEVFESVQPYMRKKLDGRQVLFSHMPYHADHTADERYTQWRLPDEGLWLVHGHTHSSVQRTSDHELNVCLEAWDLQPVAQEAIIAHMQGVVA